MLLHNGIEIKRKYRIDHVIGEGAFGEVYRVRHEYFGVLAMKVFKHAMDRNELMSCMQEPILLSRLKHPNIIGVFDADTFGPDDLAAVQEGWGDLRSAGQYGYYTMDYVPTNLEAYWRSFRNHLMPVTEAVDIVRQICEGLAIAHESSPPIIHRDLKPQNILVRRVNGAIRACITDFGLAKAVNPITLKASLRGTPLFKPPEALRERLDSPESDIWAVGVTLYLLLTDQLPFKVDEDTFEVRRGDQARPPSEHNAAVPRELDEIVLTALDEDPAGRYRNARDMLEALSACKPRAKASSLKDHVGLPVSEPKAQARPAAPQVGRPDEGGESPDDHRRKIEARLREAISLAQSEQDLSAAADILEDAIRDWAGASPQLRECVRLWRLGIYTPFAAKP